MNERIKQLVRQADKYAVGKMADVGGNYFDYYNEKFALLIVRECLTFVEPIPGSGDIDDLALEAAHDGIKEHFGIEE